MTELIMKGGVNPQLCYLPNSAASTCSTSKNANIGGGQISLRDYDGSDYRGTSFKLA